MDKAQQKALIRALNSLKKGNVDSLEIIYELTRKGVFSFVLPIMHTKERAEDVMQMTYIQLYENIEKYDRQKNPLNWLLTMAKNIALSEISKEGREISTDFMEGANVDRVYTLDSDEFDTPTIDLARRILSPSELQIVMMYVVAEFKHREIADALGLPLGTVTWKYNNALNKLRSELEKNG
ncbi:MAG: sigma-70 family RNA polymerase sigma factor [Bacilli bacterium]|nr:sigma-70 family RNA polymerase sigma factor [Bacilli bacterium]